MLIKWFLIKNVYSNGDGLDNVPGRSLVRYARPHVLVLIQEHFADPGPSVSGSMKYILYRESNHLLINCKKMTYLSNLRKNSLDNEAN